MFKQRGNGLKISKPVREYSHIIGDRLEGEMDFLIMGLSRLQRDQISLQSGKRIDQYGPWG